MTEAKVNHAFVTAMPDVPDDSLIRPSDWNDDLVMTGGENNQEFVRNKTSATGASWQDKGVSYLTDIDGNILTDTAGNALEGIDTVDANLLVNNGVSTKELTFADSPYTVLNTDDYINADSSSGSVIINLLSLATAPKKPLYISQSDGAPNTTTLTPDGSETIAGAATLVISSDGNAEMIVPFATTWRPY